MNNTKVDKIGTFPNHEIYAVFINSELSYVLSFPKIKNEFIKLNFFLQNRLTNQDISNIYQSVDFFDFLTIVPIIRNDFSQKDQYVNIGNKLANIINHVYSLCIERGIKKEKIKPIINVMSEPNKNIDFIFWLKNELKGHLENKTLEELKQEQKMISEINSSNLSDDDDLFNTLPRLQKIKEQKNQEIVIDSNKINAEVKEVSKKETESINKMTEQGTTNYNVICILVILGLTILFILREFLIK